MADKRRVLFLCTGNCCRSQMAEGILRHLADERFRAFSAGSCPAGFIHPLAIEAMRRLEIPIERQESKSWDEFAEVSMDAVITLCDEAASQPCPSWPGNPIKAHWPFPDPAYYPGTDEERVEFALRAADRLRTKIQGLVDLNWSLAPKELTRHLQFLGEI